MELNRQEHKIYYKFAFDRTQQYEIKLPMAHSIKMNFIRQYVIALHGFSANARCVLEFALEQNELMLLPKDADIAVNQTLIVYRKPSDQRINLIQQIIRNWGTSELSSQQMNELGLSYEELHEIIRSNSGQDLQRFIDEMKQNLLLDERQFMNVENEIQFHAPATTRGGKSRRSKRYQNYEDESSTTSEEELDVKTNSKGLVQKLFKKNEECCMWFEAGRCYRRK